MPGGPGWSPTWLAPPCGRVHGSWKTQCTPESSVSDPSDRIGPGDGAAGRGRGFRLVRWTLHSCSPVGPRSPEEVDVRKYEIMLILPADADDKVIGGVTDRISQILAAGGGSIDKVDRWGKRRFTFEIARQSEGFY